jgi:hypothetical protein
MVSLMPNVDSRVVPWCGDCILVPHTVWLHGFESGCRVWIHGLCATACRERRQLRGQYAVGTELCTMSFVIDYMNFFAPRAFMKDMIRFMYTVHYHHFRNESMCGSACSEVYAVVIFQLMRLPCLFVFVHFSVHQFHHSTVSNIAFLDALLMMMYGRL